MPQQAVYVYPNSNFKSSSSESSAAIAQCPTWQLTSLPSVAGRAKAALFPAGYFYVGRIQNHARRLDRIHCQASMGVSR